MPRLGPIKRFDGPFRGRKHQFMRREERTVRLPNPHPGDISTGLLSRILRQGRVGKEEWENL